MTLRVVVFLMAVLVLLFPLFVAATPPPALFCVSAEPGTALPVEEVTKALQARLQLPNTDVRTCAPEEKPQAQVLLVVRPQRTDDLLLDIASGSTAQLLPVARESLDPQRLAQVIALVAAEALRPVLDAETLAATPMSPPASLAADLEQESPGPANETTAPLQTAFYFGAGAMLDRLDILPAVAIGAELTLSFASVAASLRAAPHRSVGTSADLHGASTDLTLAAGWRSASLAARLQLQLRTLWLRHGRAAAETGGTWDVVTIGGLGLELEYPLWRWRQLEIAAATDLLFWPNPVTVTVGGQTALRQPFAEVLLAFRVRWVPGTSQSSE